MTAGEAVRKWFEAGNALAEICLELEARTAERDDALRLLHRAEVRTKELSEKYMWYCPKCAREERHGANLQQSTEASAEGEVG